MGTDTDTGTATRKTRPRPRSPSGPAFAVRFLGGALLVTFVVAGVFFGGVHHATRAATHLLLAFSLATALTIPSTTLAKGGRLPFLGGAGAVLLLGELIGLATSSDPERTIGAMSHLALGVGAGLAVGAWGHAVGRRDALLWPLLLGTLGIVVLAAVHLALGLPSLFGVLSAHEPGLRFFAPFVNQNHFAGAMLLAFPVAAATAMGRFPQRVRWVAGVLAFVFAAAVVATGAGGPLVALALEGLVLGTLLWRPFALVGLLAAPGVAWLAIQWASSQGSDTVRSGMGRLEMWRAALEMWRDQPLLGSGAGTFEHAIAPYRREAAWVAWGHAHNDWLEWLVETGVVGVLLGLAATLLLVRWAPRRSRTVRHLTLGVLGLGVYALVDFPLQIPILLMAASAAVAWRTVVGQVPLPVPATIVRVVLAAAACLQLSFAAWELRTDRVERAVAALRSDPSDAASLGIVRRWAPWRAIVEISELRSALDSGDRKAARQLARALASEHPHDPDAIAQAALALLRVGAHEEGAALADRATELAPWHREYWKMRAIAHSILDATSAAPYWADAIRAGVPGAIEGAWQVLPVGLYWVDALEDATPSQRVAMATHVLKSGDVDAALIGFRSATRDTPGRVSWGYVRALRETAAHRERLDHLLGVTGDAAESKPVLQEIASCLDDLERWEDASRAWLELFRAHGVGLGRAAHATSRAAGFDAAIALWERESLRGIRPSDQDLIDLATMRLEAGDGHGCLATLTGVRNEAPPARALVQRCREISLSDPP